MSACSTTSCGVIGKAIVIAAVCCAVSGVHWLVKPFESRGFDASSNAPVAPIGATGATGATGGAQATPPPATASGTPSTPTPTPAPGPSRDANMISLSEAKALFESGAAQWVDARTADEYARDRIGDALHISTDDWLGGKIPDVTLAMSRDMTVVVYCGGGNCDASKLVATRLRGIGFNDVKVFEDGWKGWTAAKLPTAAHPQGAPGGGGS